jgi:hypothetical protein
MALSEKENVVRKSRFSEEKMVQILRDPYLYPMHASIDQRFDQIPACGGAWTSSS